MAHKLFLGGVAPTTQKEDIEQHFSAFGTVVDAVVMFKDGRHRGFGFVTFQDQESMSLVLAEPQVIHGRTIDVKPAVPGGEAPPPKTANGAGGYACMGGGGGGCGGAYASGGGFDLGGCYGDGCGGMAGGCGTVPTPPPVFTPSAPSPSSAGGCGGGGGGGRGGYQGATDKVFIGGLAPTVTEDMLSNYFGRYGNLVDIVVMKDKMTQKPRGFGFVRYDTTDPVEQVMADYDSHQLEGKWIEVKKAVPQDQMAPTRGGKPVTANGGPPMGKGWCGGGYSMPMGKGYGGCGGYACGGGYGGYGMQMGGYSASAPPAGNPYHAYHSYPTGGAYLSEGSGKGGYRARPY